MIRYFGITGFLAPVTSAASVVMIVGGYEAPPTPHLPHREWNVSIILQINNKQRLPSGKQPTGNNQRTQNKYNLQTRSEQRKRQCTVIQYVD